jgi:outer membrane protein TolC
MKGKRMSKTLILSLVLILAIDASALAETYNLDEYLSLVKENSKELKTARKELDMADANKKEAISTAFPKLMLDADYRRNLSDYYMYVDFSAFANGEGGETQKFKVNRNNEYGLSVILSQTLFSLNVHNAIKAAKQYEKLTDFVYDASYQEIMTFAKKGFYQALLLKAVWEVMEASQQNAEDNYHNIKNKFDQGLVSQFDLLQAEVHWKDMIPQTLEAERNYQLALVSLKNLAGIPVDAEITLEGDLDDYPDMPEKLEFETILKRRPDYNALLWEEKLRRTAVSAERAGYLPTLTGNFIYNFSSQSDEWELDEKNDNFILGLNLSWPLFTGGYTRAKVNKARIELEKTKIRIDQTEDAVHKEITDISLRLKEAEDRIASAEAIWEAAEKAFQIAQASAKSGLATQLELKEARVAFDRAQLTYYAAIFEYLSAYFDWEKAVGEVN